MSSIFLYLFDGLVVNHSVASAIVALAYKGLWMVEAMIRTAKSILETRPIYHKCDETIRGHVFCSFLALRLKAEAERRMDERNETWEWAEVLRGLDNLQEGCPSPHPLDRFPVKIRDSFSYVHLLFSLVSTLGIGSPRW